MDCNCARPRKVEQKRAKIAARIPAIAPEKARSKPAAVTSLVDLYAQMHHDSGASGQQPVLTVTPSSKTAPANGWILDSRAQNACSCTISPLPPPQTPSQ